jgi:predicted small lipoprotein YifL
MKPLLILALIAPTLFALAGCGADGPPVAPGVTVSGETKIGIGGTLK